MHPEIKAAVTLLRRMLSEAPAVTVVTHVNPDADTLGTGLGIYLTLKRELNKPVEIVNPSKDLPRHLDFLQGFEKIKCRIDFDNALVIACDCGSVDRLGVDVTGKKIVNIDHHQSNTHYGTLNVVVPTYAASSQVAFRLFEALYSIHADAAQAFYAALFSDTRYFSLPTVNEEVFRTAAELTALGCDPAETARNFTQRRSLASLRILERALHSLRLYRDATVAVMTLRKEDFEATGATMPDIEGVVDYARSLATVHIAVTAIEQDDGTIKVSLRSKGEDVSRIAEAFGGGGHKQAAGFELTGSSLEETVDTILQKIESSIFETEHKL